MKILSADLLRQAYSLLDSATGRPRQIDLRRAVSNAYYAVFHALTDRSARLVVSGASRERFRRYVRRGFPHGRMRLTCGKFGALPTAKRRGTAVIPLLPVVVEEVTTEIRRIATAFYELQEERHDADYDHTRSYTKSEVINRLAQAEDAIALIEQLDRHADADYAFLLALHTH